MHIENRVKGLCTSQWLKVVPELRSEYVAWVANMTITNMTPAWKIAFSSQPASALGPEIQILRARLVETCSAVTSTFKLRMLCHALQYAGKHEHASARLKGSLLRGS